MKKEKYPPDPATARRVQTENREQRIKRAAGLSRTQTATEIMTELDISKRTLQRYMADPLWQKHGGCPLTFTGHGRPTRESLSASEKRTLNAAHNLHKKGLKWYEIAEQLEISIDRLRYLRRKERDTESKEA